MVNSKYASYLLMIILPRTSDGNCVSEEFFGLVDARKSGVESRSLSLNGLSLAHQGRRLRWNVELFRVMASITSHGASKFSIH